MRHLRAAFLLLITDEELTMPLAVLLALLT